MDKENLIKDFRVLFSQYTFSATIPKREIEALLMRHGIELGNYSGPCSNCVRTGQSFCLHGFIG